MKFRDIQKFITDNESIAYILGFDKSARESVKVFKDRISYLTYNQDNLNPDPEKFLVIDTVIYR